MHSMNAHLLTLLEDAARGLPRVEKKKLFGCEGLFAAGNIFSLIWKTGRIGVKIPDAAKYGELRAMDGAEPWTPGGKMVMSHWLLVPEAFHDDEDTLAEWVRRAHGLALNKTPTVKKKAPAKKKAPVKAAKAAPKKKAPAKKKTASRKTAKRR